MRDGSASAGCQVAALNQLEHSPQYSLVYGRVERDGRVEPLVSLSPLALASLSPSPPDSNAINAVPGW